MAGRIWQGSWAEFGRIIIYIRPKSDLLTSDKKNSLFGSVSVVSHQKVDPRRLGHGDTHQLHVDHLWLVQQDDDDIMQGPD